MNLTELSVALGADLGDFDKGLNAAVSKIQAFGGDVTRAANAAGDSFAGIAAGTNNAAASYAGATGKMQAANRGFATSAQQAAEAAGRAGGSAASAGNGFSSLASNVGKSNRDLANFSATASTIGGALSAGVTLPLVALGAGALNAAGDMQALEKGFAATYKGAEPLSDALARVKELAKMPGLGLKEALQGATNLQAAGFSAGLATRALGAFGNALATVGKGKADLDGVGLALGQIASKGKISAEEIGQLAERVPQIRSAMQAAFGTSDTEVLQKMGISATEFVERVTTELEKLPKVTGGINNAFENLGDATTTALSKVGTSLNNAFNIEGLLGRAADALSRLGDSFAGLSPTMQKAVFIVGGLAAAIGPVLLAIGAVGAAVPVVVAGLGYLGAAFAAVGTAAGAAWGFILGPIAPIALAIAGLVAAGVLLYQNWDEISGRAAQLGNYLRDKLLAVLGPLQNGLRTVGAAALALGFTTIGTSAIAASGGVGALKSGVEGLQFAVGNTRAEMESLRTAFTAIGKQTFDPSLNLNPDAFLSLSNVAKLSAAPVAKLNGLLQELQEKLKTAQEGLQNATTEKQVAGYNQSIAAIEKEIKRLEELGIASKQAATAFEKVQESLRDVDRLSQALGNSYDYIGERSKALENGAKTLVAAGFAPQSRQVQGLLAQLRALPTAYDAVTAAQPKGLAEFKPVIVADVQTNPLDTTATQRIQQQLARLGLKVPPLDITGFTASANELEALAARLTALPDAGGLDVTKPINNLANLKNAFATLTGVKVGAFDVSAPLRSLEEVRQELSNITGIAVADLPSLEGLDVSVPITNVQQLLAAVDTLPTAGMDLAPVGGLDITAPLDSLARLRTALNQAIGGTVPALDTKPFEESVNFATATLNQLPAAVSGLTLPPLPPLPAFDTQAYVEDINGVRVALAQPFEMGTLNGEAFVRNTQAVEDASSRVVNAVTGMSNAGVTALAAFNTKAEEIFETLPAALGGLFASIADTVATQIGNIVAGVSSFGDGMEAAFKGALGIVADFASQFGQQMVALGIAKVLADSFATVPGPLMIAAGLGLIAVAGVTKALMSKGPKLSSGGGGSAAAIAPRTPSSSYTSPTPSTKSTEPTTQNNTQVIQLTIDGREITKAIKLTTDRLGRVIGQG